MKDFTTLDCAILTRIAEAPCTFLQISTRVEHLAKPHANRDAFRVVDRRLQALRKLGHIYFDKKQWRMTKSTHGR